MNIVSRSSETSERRTSVLVVGGALTGLSSALFLARHGVRCLLVERHPGLLIHPRLRGINPRTVELYRQVGLEPAILAASSMNGEAFKWIAVRAETLASEEWIPAEEQGGVEGLEEVSPCSIVPIDQDKLEILLRAKVSELGADVRFSTELTSFRQDDTGVTAVIKDRRTADESTVRADYLIAADGYASLIRQHLGIGLDGPGVFVNTMTVLVEADLRPALRGRRFNIAYLQRPKPGSGVLAHDTTGRRWIFGTGYSPERGESVRDYSDERCVELVREASGLPDLAVTIHPQIPGTNLKVLGFPIGAQLARRYHLGRVFLAGDAAHIVPPTGGFGGNTGVQDAHNLAWKLAAVLEGRAGPGLLDTYHDERHPIGLHTMGQALARWQARIGTLSATEPQPLVDYSAVTFGHQYRSSAVLGAPSDDAPLLLPQELTGRPGTRAPHLAVTLGGRKMSTIDLHGRHFTLLAGTNGAAWMLAAERVGKRLDVPLGAYRFGVELTGAEGETAQGIGTEGALLVRPDGFVAWRSSEAATDPEAELEHALRTILSR
ncbi:MAG: FAD-dependent oxidoreductase [Actinomycetota bacterium]